MCYDFFMKKELKPYLALCDAIGKLFYPNVEVVMHDLEAKKLVHIVNAFSKRRVGDAMLSELKDLNSIKENWVGPYDKISSDGKRLKAVSIIVCDVEEKPIVEEVTFSKIRYFNKRVLLSKIRLFQIRRTTNWIKYNFEIIRNFS